MQGRYIAFLLRFWRERENAPWRCSLENPHTAERTGFAGVDELLAYLETITADEVGAVHSARRAFQARGLQALPDIESDQSGL